MGALSISLVMLVMVRIVLELKKKSAKHNDNSDKEEFMLLIREDLEITSIVNEPAKISILGKEMRSYQAQSDVVFDSAERISMVEITSIGDSFCYEEVKQKTSLINCIDEKEAGKTMDCEVSELTGFDDAIEKVMRIIMKSLSKLVEIGEKVNAVGIREMQQ